MQGEKNGRLDNRLTKYLKNVPLELTFEDTGCSRLSGGKENRLISFNLRAGFNHIDGGDFNSTLRGYKVNDSGSSELFALSDEVSEINWMNQFSAELVFNLTDFFKLGLEVGYSGQSASVSNSYTIVEPTVVYSNQTHYDQAYTYEVTYTGKAKSKLTSVPIFANIYLVLPIKKPLHFYLKAGIGYSWGRLKYNFPCVLDITEYYELYNWVTGNVLDTRITYLNEEQDYSERSRADGLVLNSALGLDFSIKSWLSLVYEFGYQAARFKNWKGESSGNLVRTQDAAIKDGNLWHVEIADSTDFLVFSDNHGMMSENAREAMIKMNGFAIAVGLKIRL
jgi:opacity protein-like surface antigen